MLFNYYSITDGNLRSHRRQQSKKTERAVRDAPVHHNNVNQVTPCAEARVQPSHSKNLIENEKGSVKQSKLNEVVPLSGKSSISESSDIPVNGKYASLVFSVDEREMEISSNSSPIDDDLDPILQGIDSEDQCELHLTNLCNWPHCNPTCPTLVDPFTGKMNFFI